LANTGNQNENPGLNSDDEDDNAISNVSILFNISHPKTITEPTLANTTSTGNRNGGCDQNDEDDTTLTTGTVAVATTNTRRSSDDKDNGAAGTQIIAEPYPGCQHCISDQSNFDSEDSNYFFKSGRKFHGTKCIYCGGDSSSEPRNPVFHCRTCQGKRIAHSFILVNQDLKKHPRSLQKFTHTRTSDY
jgi:hypothetical protein